MNLIMAVSDKNGVKFIALNFSSLFTHSTLAQPPYCHLSQSRFGSYSLLGLTRYSAGDRHDRCINANSQESIEGTYFFLLRA